MAHQRFARICCDDHRSPTSSHSCVQHLMFQPYPAGRARNSIHQRNVFGDARAGAIRHRFAPQRSPSPSERIRRRWLFTDIKTACAVLEVTRLKRSAVHLPVVGGECAPPGSSYRWRCVRAAAPNANVTAMIAKRGAHAYILPDAFDLPIERRWWRRRGQRKLGNHPRTFIECEPILPPRLSAEGQTVTLKLLLQALPQRPARIPTRAKTAGSTSLYVDMISPQDS